MRCVHIVLVITSCMMILCSVYLNNNLVKGEKRHDYFKVLDLPSDTSKQSRIWMTTFSHKFTIHTIVLTPSSNEIVAIGTTAFIPCPCPNFEINSFAMQLRKKIYRPIKVQNEDLQGGPLLVLYFDIEQSLWKELSCTTTESAIIYDFVYNTSHNLPILVDPSLQKTTTQNHFLSATTTIRKQYTIYRGLGKYDASESKNMTSTARSTVAANSWSDDNVRTRLSHWLSFHRQAGVDHFYIIDNEANTSKPNIQVTGNDITYLRASHMLYDTMRCYTDSNQKTKQHVTVVGQLMLENSVLRMANTHWLMMCDLDEFFVVGEKFERNLTRLIDFYQNRSCMGEKPIQCVNLQQTGFETVFCLNFLPQIMTSSNERLFEVLYRFKPIVRPSLTSTVSVHYSIPFNAIKSTKSTIPPRHGWLAHYNKRGEVGNHNWTILLSTIHNISNFLRDN
jgi:Glycosyl transferase family 2